MAPIIAPYYQRHQNQNSSGASEVLATTAPVAGVVILGGVVFWGGWQVGLLISRGIDAAINVSSPLTPEGEKVYRGGNDLTPKPGELKIDPNNPDNVIPYPDGKGGVSTNTNPNSPKVTDHGAPHKITSVPDGLKVGSQNPKTGHVPIDVAKPMPKQDATELFKQIKTKPVE